MRHALSAPEFILLHGLDLDLYQELVDSGLSPKTYRIKDREFVSQESAAAWRRRMERLSAKEARRD